MAISRGPCQQGELPFELAFDGACRFGLTNYVSNQVITYRKRNVGTVSHLYSLEANCDDILFDGTNMWVSNRGSGTVSKISRDPTLEAP